MKKTQNTHSIHMHVPVAVWTLCCLTAVMYAVGVGTITYNVVERKSVQGEVRKLTARIAESEAAYADTTKNITIKDNGLLARTQYIKVDTAAAIGMVQ